MQLYSGKTTKMAQQPMSAVQIKQERIDERELEINRLAVEMAEKNRQKMISQAPQIAQQTQASQQALQRAGGQQMITFYFSKEKDKTQCSQDSLLPKKPEEKKKGTIDEESQRGRFGWSTIHNVYIPYLFRGDQKYCAVRMVESRLLSKYLSYLPPEITTCIHVRSYYITEMEAKLLNEINCKHCEGQFGSALFTTKDLIVKVHDADCFFKFLDTCFKKLVHRSLEQSEFCGFVRINGESVVPYTIKSGVKYVPLFYFEGETDTLKLKAEKIDGWELAYLKFCCKVQGIRNELFASDTCAVVSLEDVKQYFPKDTLFEDWWPQKTAESMRVVSQGTKSTGAWTQRPPVNPTTNQTSVGAHITSPASNNKTPVVVSRASPSSTSNLAAANHTSGSSIEPLSSSLSNPINNLMYSQWAASLMNGQVQAQAQAAVAYSLTQDQMRRFAMSSAAPLISLAQSSSQSSRSHLARPSASTVTTLTGSQLGTNNSLDSTLRHLGYQQNRQGMTSVLNSGRSYSSQANSTAPPNVSISNSKSMSKAPPPLIPVANGMRTDNLSSHKGVGRNGVDKPKLVDVPPFRPDPSRQSIPYKARKVMIDNKPVLVINYSAYSYADINMVALQDIIKDFFPTVGLAECIEVFQNVLKVNVFKANWHQVYALMKAWGTETTPEVVPLIYATDFINCLTQIKYIFQRHQSSLTQSQSKRVRIT